MKKLFGFLMCVLICTFLSCKRDHTFDLYTDLQCVIVEMSGDNELRVGKHHNIPVTAKVALIYAPRVRLYAEITSNDMSKIVTDRWWYNHKPGDTIHFDYILKSRFFPINP